MLKDIAQDCLILASENVYKEAEAQGADGGNAAFMMEECCEQYDDVRRILIGQSPYPEYRQEVIIKQFMKTYNVTKQQIIDYRQEKENWNKEME